MNARARPAILALIGGLLLGCSAKREIGRNCPAGDCSVSVLDAAATACGADFVLPATDAVADEELHRCQLFTLNGLQSASGDRVYITKAMATMTPYSHEIDVRIAPEIADVADGPVECETLLNRPLRWLPLIESQEGSEDWEFTSAPLIAARSQRLLVAERFVNPSAGPIAVGVALRIECANTSPARPSQVFEFTDGSSHVVGPAEQVTISGSCSFDRGVALWRLYRPPDLITSFSAWRGAPRRPLWHGSAQWSIDLAPSLQLSRGEGLEWECVYENRSDVPFEIGGDSGYVCGLMGIYQLEHDGEDAEPLRCMH
jgi:hypothetical protein